MRPEDMHLSEGEIQAYQDQELPASQSRRAESHLASCHTCQVKASEIYARSQRMTGRFSSLQPVLTASSNTALPAARRRLAEKLEQEKEIQTMKPKTFLHIPRLAWAVIAVVAALAIAIDLRARPRSGKQLPGSVPCGANPRGPD